MIIQVAITESRYRVNVRLPYHGKFTLHEIKVLEINANLMVNDFRIKKIKLNAKKEDNISKLWTLAQRLPREGGANAKWEFICKEGGISGFLDRCSTNVCSF